MPAVQSKPPSAPVLLDCTIRDGNYAIDFKFTEADTRLVVSELAKLGFRWIEIGHGLGLGAVEAGKESMPGSDVDMIRAARSVAGDAKIGAFFIPGIGTVDQMHAARDAGLDFIRIGYDVDQIERAWPYLADARRLGLTPCLNMMKSYAIGPEEFAENVRRSEEEGAEVAYFVDSAGYMLPEKLGDYFDAARAVSGCRLGFHGHNNLMLAIGNCMAAFEHGAEFLDASLCGLGRSAGNANTEILVAVLERYGYPTGVDLFALMDMIAAYMWPLVERVRPHDMMGVVAGYAGFHSSFLPRVEKIASRHRAEIRRVVSRVAHHDRIRIDDGYVEVAARECADTVPSEDDRSLVGFDSPRLAPDRISNTLRAVDQMCDALLVSATKRRDAISVLHLVPTAAATPGIVIPEFVVESLSMVMGRVTFGSLDSLAEVVKLARSKTSLFLLNREHGWASATESLVRRLAPDRRVHTISDREVRSLFLSELLQQAAGVYGHEALLLYQPDRVLLDACKTGLPFDNAFVFGADRRAVVSRQLVVLDDWRDWDDLQLRFNVIVCGHSPGPGDAAMLSRALCPGGELL
ncbi:MAG: hypothetical protein AB7F89_09160, partial [Pirellulaceae bacterium]